MLLNKIKLKPENRIGRNPEMGIDELLKEGTLLYTLFILQVILSI